MAAIISISSDEEQLVDVERQPKKKKRKTEPVICLDDDEEKNKLIEEDDDVILTEELCNGNDNSTAPDQSKSMSPIKDKTGEKGIDNDIIIETDDKQRISPTLKDSLVDKVEKIDIEESARRKESESKNEIVLSSKEDDLGKMFERNNKMSIFLNLCLTKIDNEETTNLFKSKIPFCKKLFDKIDDYVVSDQFNAFLDDKIASSKVSSLVAISSFNDVYQHLKSKVRSASKSGELQSKHKVIIAKLEHALAKVQKVLVKLEESEVDFDEEEDSAYIKMQRYRERAVKIYEKICKYRKEDVNANNMLFSRLDFSGSSYPEFNHVINKKFKNNSVFPTYYAVEQSLQKVVKNKNMNLSNSEVKQEARDCFKNLGNLLQKRRKMDLLNIHSHYLLSNDDPAFEDKELDNKLKTSCKEANSKIDEICQKYVKLQDLGMNPSLSSDSDDSKYETTEEDDGEEGELVTNE